MIQYFQSLFDANKKIFPFSNISVNMCCGLGLIVIISFQIFWWDLGIQKWYRCPTATIVFIAPSPSSMIPTLEGRKNYSKQNKSYKISMFMLVQNTNKWQISRYLSTLKFLSTIHMTMCFQTSLCTRFPSCKLLSFSFCCTYDEYLCEISCL